MRICICFGFESNFDGVRIGWESFLPALKGEFKKKKREREVRFLRSLDAVILKHFSIYSSL